AGTRSMHGTTHRASAACSWPAAATPSTWRSPPRWGPRLSRSSPSGLLRSKSRSRRQNQQIGSELTVAGAAHHMTDETIAPPAGRFTAATAGPSDAPLVILLHGYPQTRHTWRHQVPALGAAGYRAGAPDQRGYSAGGGPHPGQGARGLRNRSARPGRARPRRRRRRPGPAVSPCRPRLGRSCELGHRAPPSGAHPVAGHSLAPAPGRVPPRVPRERRRPAASLPSPQGVPRSGHRPPSARGRGAAPARAAGRAGRPGGRRRRVPVGARGAGGARGGAGLVPGGRDAHRCRGRRGLGADALHLGRSRPDRRPPSPPCCPPISPPNGDILSAVRRRTARAPTTEEPIVAKDLQIWMNGRLVSQAEAVLPVNSAAVFYATNVFEGLRAYWNAEDGELYCFRLAEHFARLRESMKMMRFTVSYSDMDLYEEGGEVLRGNEIREDVHIHLVAYVAAPGLDSTSPTGLYINPRRRARITDGNGLKCCITSWQ